ncbi:Hypothetical_protein [Hexamita inflata]|uniref:Hypothetical_protein n=1 Tax=Hexamita inflata TaxID=28002 RepID=A0AA86NB66_9EUKA|nr:Hypothetical protein HINF_LOCUS3716 [Hexamita inflata]
MNINKSIENALTSYNQIYDMVINCKLSQPEVVFPSIKPNALVKIVMKQSTITIQKYIRRYQGRRKLLIKYQILQQSVQRQALGIYYNGNFKSFDDVKEFLVVNSPNKSELASSFYGMRKMLEVMLKLRINCYRNLKRRVDATQPKRKVCTSSKKSRSQKLLETKQYLLASYENFE